MKPQKRLSRIFRIPPLLGKVTADSEPSGGILGGVRHPKKRTPLVIVGSIDRWMRLRSSAKADRDSQPSHTHEPAPGLRGGLHCLRNGILKTE